MFGNALGWPHLIIILAILLLLFGAPKLPGLAKSIAQSMKIFRTEMGPNSHNTTPNGSSAAPSAGTTNTSTPNDEYHTPSSTDYPPKS
ncbi:twin-arginine translocase TatA/TatE family subunit [Frondihabitans peucedani]|jgi:sec-independent protein translocase protein TatA|uniref:Sec-independent protein translocase protein TatA n=1 Tax=Frondihabitans peucedani TaxID=598626 RepID=A0ABP8DXV3_9MICO